MQRPEDGDFLINPTDTLLQWLMASYGMTPDRARQYLRLGRLAMALEIITVIRILGQHSLLIYSPEETISVLQTLLNDQGLAEQAAEWYDRLCEWRRLKTANDAASSHVARPSGRVARRVTPALPGSTSSQRRNGRSQDPPST